MNDEVAGEVPVAFIVRFDGSNITEDEIKQFISKQVRPVILPIDGDFSIGFMVKLGSLPFMM